MDQIIEVVPYGSDLPGDVCTTADVTALLSGLKDSLRHHGYDWRDVSLLIVANSKLTKTQKDQFDSDQSLLAALDWFCHDERWYPSLIGSSTFSSFYRDYRSSNADISNGLLFVAVISAVMSKIPVEIETSQGIADRRFAGRNALRKGVDSYRKVMLNTYGIPMDRPEVFQSSTCLLLSSGSGHIEGKFVDFKDCYSVGQELLDESGEAKIIGGCASNRSSTQLQCIYYSEHVAAKTSYRCTYNHAAALCILPYASASYMLKHPYTRADRPKLNIEFDPHDMYAEGRYYYIRRIDGKSPIEFLSEYWDFTPDDLVRMAADRTPLPAEPKAHLVTIASSLSKFDKNIWPNVPIWLDEIDGEILLRLVRAEAEDSNYYLMELNPEQLANNAKELAHYVGSNYARGAGLAVFLCESRKYVLRERGSNAEATEILSSVPDDSVVAGIYLNGEYSVGPVGSIGYHNYSQIGAVLPQRSVAMLPFKVQSARKIRRGTQLFISHASRDKALVEKIVKHLTAEVRNIVLWIDERDLITGDHLTQEIRKAITHTSSPSLFLVFLSHAAVESSWVQKELKWAIETEAATRRHFILPIMLDDVLGRLRTTWDGDTVEKLVDKVHLSIRNDYSDEGVQALARKLSADLKEWLRRAAEDDEGSSEFSTLRYDPS